MSIQSSPRHYPGFTGVPIGFLAVWTYYKQGYVDLGAASLICAGFFLGGLLGAKLATGSSNVADHLRPIEIDNSSGQ